MEALAIVGALFLGYGYRKSSQAMKDLEDQKVKENYTPKYKKSVERRTAGTRPYTYQDTEYAYDDHASNTNVNNRPAFLHYRTPDPAYQRQQFGEEREVTALNPNFHDDLQHFTNEHWDTWSGPMALRNPNESYRGDFSEIGNARLYRPPRFSRQPFAK